MKWYIEKLTELENAAPVISACGDDCAVCPRYLARTEEELHQTAVLWHKIGWRDKAESNEDIKCRGCGCKGTCTFMLLPCQREKGVDACRHCDSFPCDKINAMLENSDKKEAHLKSVCESEAMFKMLKRAFYEKEKNLKM